MRLNLLRVRNLRCLVEAELAPAPGLNLLTGGNGAGKTSLIEAVHLLGYGRSFRGRVRDGLVRGGQTALELFAEWQDGQGRRRRVGLRHTGQEWEARLDGAPAPSLTELCAELAVVTFEPGSHELLAGGGEHRRRFLDWALFHVEPEFLPVWRRYARALKQRNALLKRQPVAAALEPWDQELAQAGEILSRLRSAYLARLEPVLASTAEEFLAELGRPGLRFQPGWRREEQSLADALLLSRERDLALGYTSLGPHRADWRVEYPALPGREALSRGQEKLTALACVLAQARAFAADRGEWPLVCLDDLASELDRVHLARALTSLVGSGAQILLTATEMPDLLAGPLAPQARFHVEQGVPRPL
ncbi:DNA replication/repair protein RecF [Arenimonas fontis]|uniref:DNA replication and repair protein RecF n=1 Tax=Arenimonas fontis TaxID=2608255 RepID=A0A5B2Z768_9GAMM|nr:DNA replication/repair protein RecF [Arenimonas fontis]KAA2284036.1 DNA replication/repair protein RecF [Arenimonas fontis]